MLALLVERAGERGLEELLLPVDGEKPAPVRVIEQNGKKPAHQDVDPATGEVTTWYWVPL